MRSLVITVPASERDAVNQALETLEFGPDNLSVPMKDGQIISDLPTVDEEGEPVEHDPTHYSCHWWCGDDEFAQIEAIRDTELANCTINASFDLTNPLGVFGATNGDYVKIYHKEFSPGQWGWRAEFVAQANEFEAGVRAIAIFGDPEHTQYLYTTGAFTLNDGVWSTEWNAGLSDKTDIHWGLLWASQIEHKSTLTADAKEDVGYLRQGIPGGLLPDGTEPEIERWIAGGGSGVQGSYVIDVKVIHDRPADGGKDWVFQSKANGNLEEPGRDDPHDRYWEPLYAVEEEGVEPVDPPETEPEPEPEPEAWVDSGATFSNLIAGGVIGVSDSSVFTPPQQLRIAGMEFPCTGIHSPGALLVTLTTEQSNELQWNTPSGTMIEVQA